MDYRIESVLRMIERDVRTVPGPRKIARELRLSESRFYDLFHKDTGMPPATYIRRLRYSKARNLLVHSNLTIKEITGVVGIEDVSHFVRTFQKLYGSSPRSFRRMHGRPLDDDRPLEMHMPPGPSGGLANKS